MTRGIKYWRDDDADDKAVDAELTKPGSTAEVTTPPDLEELQAATQAAVITLNPGELSQAMSQSQLLKGQPLDLASLPDELLQAELNRRKTASIDAEILQAEAYLIKLRAERAILLSGGQVTEHAVPPGLEQSTSVNPFTGKERPKKIPPGTLRPEQCPCEGGCYLCVKATS